MMTTYGSCSVAFNMAVRENNTSILPYIGTLFYISKIFGITPLSFREYYSRKSLQLSTSGVVWVVVSLIIYAVGYHVLTEKFFLEGETTTNQNNTLTIVIGYFLVYIGPVMMGVDLIVGIVNQKKLITLFDQFKFVDEQLLKENIMMDNKKLRFRIHLLLVIVFCGELTVTSLTFFYFFELSAWLWYMSCVPIIINVVEKIWFASLLFALRQRFQAMNQYLDDLGEMQLKRNKTKEIEVEKPNWNLGYLHQEIFIKKPAFKRSNKIIPVLPWDETTHIKLGKDELTEKTVARLKDEIFDIMKMEVKLNTVCQLHDEVCEMGKELNSMWSLQMLLLMAYGFMSITAQFYFLYCALVQQEVPALFKSAKNIVISLIFITYTAAKCVYLIFLSWQTRLESRKTGVCLHKISLAVDENKFYEIVNHLSLKMLNHSVNFSACGFFNLDMDTLYAVTGAITSYLIILIQFNLAANRAKNSNLNLNSTTTMLTPTPTPI